MRMRTLGLLATAMVVATAGVVQAKTVKVGLLLPYSWVNKNHAQQIDNAIKLYMKLKGDSVGGHKIEIIRKDSTGPKPDVAGRLAQELVTRDKVDILAGVVYSNNGFRVAAVANKAKIPLIIMNAGAAALTTKSEYIARVSFTMWHAGYPMGEYAATKMGVKKAITMYANYAPGKDSNNAFKTGFTKHGGEVVDEIPLPFPKMPDHTPFLQRVKDTKPDALYAFVPAGKWATALIKTFGDLGLKDAGIKLIGPGDITDDVEINNMGDTPIGLVNAHHYSAAHPSPENKAFVAAWKKEYGADSTTNFMSVQGWDGMEAIYHLVATLDGNIEADKAMAALKGWKNDASPRGPIMIDPETRDIIQNTYMRRVEKVGDSLANTEFETIPMVKDKWKELNK